MQDPNDPQTAPGLDAEESAPAAHAPPEVMPSTEELLRQSELRAQEHHDAWLRAKAETENVRRRAQGDIASAHKYAIENFAERLVPVRDALEAALSIENATLESLKSGVELTLKQLVAVFEKANLVELNPAGQPFDPHKHQAIGMVPSDSAPNTVVSVVQKGYLLHERLVRPALVMVAKPREG